MQYIWVTCWGCNGKRFLKIGNKNMLCPVCKGDSVLLDKVYEKTLDKLENNIRKDID